MLRSTIVAAPLLIGLTLALAGCPPDPAYPRLGKDDLKVTRVVLYQNGIGYFERRGRVDGDVVSLRIRPEQIADILKSLTVIDLADGRAVSVALPVEKSRARMLAELPEQVRRSGGLIALAAAFRGARAEVSTKSDTVAGRIVGVEQTAGAKDQPPIWRLTLMVGPKLQAFPMAKVTAIRILDRTLEVGLRKALDVALDQGAWKPVELKIHLAGTRPHDLLVSYVVEMPTWKPAYRIVLDRDGQALLQGWAVVDNVSGEDWNGVSLSLTAGTPLTFTYDLYTPRYVRRADLSPRGTEVALAPPAPPPPVTAKAEMAEAPAEEALAANKPRASRRRSYKKKVATRGRLSLDDLASGPGGDAPSPEPTVTAAALEQNFRALVQGSKVGSLFRYDLEEKVWVPDRQSALVSILNARVKAEDILLYNVERSGASPYRAVRFTNSTPYVMEKGPIAIYNEGTFVGEALSDQVDPGLSAFIPSPLYPRVHISIDDAHHQAGVHLVKIVRGRVTVEVKRHAQHTYAIDNQSPEAGTLWLQRQRRTGWHLTQPTKDVIDERGVYFVPVKLTAKSKTKVTVAEETPSRRVVEVYSSDARRAISLFLSGPEAARSPKLAAALREVMAVQDRLGKLEERLSRLRQDQRSYGERQEQVRKNLKILGKSARNQDLKRKLARTMAELETKLNTVNRQVVATRMERSELRNRLAVLMKSITLRAPRR